MTQGDAMNRLVLSKEYYVSEDVQIKVIGSDFQNETIWVLKNR